VGCGFGETLRVLATNGRQCSGLEVSEQLVEQAGAADGPVDFICGSGVHFDFADEPFDAIFSVDFLEHLHPDDMVSHMKSVWRSLVPKGCYVAMTPHAAVGPHDISKYFDRTPTGFHLREYSYASLADAGRAAGFQCAGSPWFPFRRYQPDGPPPRLAPVTWKVFLERLTGRLPRGALKRSLFKAAALYTVCIVFTRPA
jgi:SAM-dependent methyltransferase